MDLHRRRRRDLDGGGGGRVCATVARRRPSGFVLYNNARRLRGPDRISYMGPFTVSYSSHLVLKEKAGQTLQHVGPEHESYNVSDGG
jgi:hypothetical protein